MTGSSVPVIGSRAGGSGSEARWCSEDPAGVRGVGHGDEFAHGLGVDRVIEKAAAALADGRIPVPRSGADAAQRGLAASQRLAAGRHGALGITQARDEGFVVGAVGCQDRYWASGVSTGESMTVWAELGWGLVFGVAMAAVAFNCRDVAWRIHGFLSNAVGANRLLTPTVIRLVCGALAVASLVGVATER